MRPETDGNRILRDSEALSNDAKASAGDRRVRRSRAALTAALTELTFERGYRGLSPNDIAERADVGRSTFYSHYSGLGDLLAESLDKHLSILAQCTLKPEFDPALLTTVEHFWEQRAAREVLRGRPGAAISRLLSSRLEAAWLGLRRSRRSRSAAPPSLVATQLAAGQLAVLDAWLSGRTSASPDQVSRLLHQSTYAAAIASL